MNGKVAYCTRCNRQVRLLLTDTPLHGGQAPLPDAPKLICLECSDACEGEVCPLTNLSYVVMEHRKGEIEQQP